MQLSQAFGDELQRRALVARDALQGANEYLLYKANARQTECRAYLRNVQSLEAEARHETTSAPPAPEPLHGAEASGAPPETTGASAPEPTTAGGAGNFPVRVNPAWEMHCSTCALDFGHDGECRPLPPQETSTPESPSEHQGSGPRGPKAAEGVGEADRAKPGRVDLAEHLAVLKGGAA